METLEGSSFAGLSFKGNLRITLWKKPGAAGAIPSHPGYL